MDCLPGSSVHGISQAVILEWIAISFSRGSSRARDWACISCTAGRFFTTEPPGKTLVVAAAAAKSLQSCPTLCDPIDGSPRGSPVPEILQARTLEWVAIAFTNAGKWKVKAKSLESCPTLSDPMGCGPPGSSIHGIFQARVLEWGAIAFSASSSYNLLNTQFVTVDHPCVPFPLVLVATLHGRYNPY